MTSSRGFAALALCCLGCGSLVYNAYPERRSRDQVAVVFVSNADAIDRSYGHMIVVNEVHGGPGSYRINRDAGDRSDVDLFDRQGPRFIQLLPGEYGVEYGYSRISGVDGRATVTAGRCYRPVIACPGHIFNQLVCRPEMEEAACPRRWPTRERALRPFKVVPR